MNSETELKKLSDATEATRHNLETSRKDLETLSRKRDSLIVENALSGELVEKIAMIEQSIQTVQQRVEDSEKILSALTGRLPEYQKRIRIEAAQRDAEKYQDTLKALKDTLNNPPPIESLVELLRALQSYKDSLTAYQADFFQGGKALYETLHAEGVESINGITKDTLRNDRQSLDYSKMIEAADAMIDVGHAVNILQFQLFNTCVHNPDGWRFPVEEQKPEVEESSPSV